MDEPTASLTHQEVDALLATIHELKRQGIATVFVSHWSRWCSDRR
jgi:ABC-type sugar transport system ATPase subunit